MATELIFLFAALATVANGDITGQNPQPGTCLCFTGNSVNIRSEPVSSACGTRIVGSANSGQCFRYMGNNKRCSIKGRSYSFFKINSRPNQGWVAGIYLKVESSAKCNSPVARVAPVASPARNGNDYTCEVTHQGMRVQESRYPTEHDCLDSSCRSTCKGGQCVAYVKCKCKKNGNYPPMTKLWRPGQKLKGTDGKCNRNIAPNTAIATFSSGGSYTEHAAVFIKCLSDYSVQVYHQYCGHSVHYATYDSGHRFFSSFATIRSSSEGPSSVSCRIEASGPNWCPAAVPGCK